MRFPVLLFALAMSGGCKPAPREATTNNPVKWTVSSPRGELRPAAAVTVPLTAIVDKGWYIYSLTQKPGGPTPMSVTVGPTPQFQLRGDVTGPKPIVIFDKEFGIDTERYEGAPQFTVPVTVGPATTRAQSAAMEIKVRFQACNANFCLPARTVSLSTPVQVARP